MAEYDFVHEWDSRYSKPQLFVEHVGEGTKGVSELLQEAIGEHYDIKIVEVIERDRSGDPWPDAQHPLVIDLLILIYDKGGTTPRLTLWTNR